MSVCPQPQPHPLDWPTALAQLRELLPQWQRRRPGQIHQFCLPLQETDPLHWLQNQPIATRVYWSDRGHQQQMAGLGAALSVQAPLSEALDEVQRWQQVAPPTACFLGGAPFDADHSQQTACFVLPQLLVQQTPEGCFLLVHFAPGLEGSSSLEDLLSLLDQIQLDPPAVIHPAPFAIFERQDFPAVEDWQTGVKEALAQIEKQHCQKIVLARQTRFLLNQSPDPFALLDQLRGQAPRAFHFGWQEHPNESAFLSITPERLFRRHRQLLEGEAIAGTRPRGKTAMEDALLAQEMFQDTKEVREHLLVLRFLEERFALHCQDVERLSHLEPLKVQHVQHLQSRLQGRLHEEVTDKELLTSLHPTPAVCGLPKAEARAQISRLENFDRGWYAGPIGYLSRVQSEFAVGIRSGVLQGQALTVHTGAGIVEGSDPAREWQELEHKLRSWKVLLEQEP